MFSFSFVEAAAVPDEVDGDGLERRCEVEEAAGEEGVTGRFVGTVAGDLRGREGEIVEDF